VLTIQGRFSSLAAQPRPASGAPGRSIVPPLRSDRLVSRRSRIPKTTSTYDGLTVRLDRTLGDIWSMVRRSASAR